MVKIAEGNRIIARKLRVVEKKSIREIAGILGVGRATVGRWSKEENWPDPQKERRELAGILAASASPSGTKGPSSKASGRPRKTEPPSSSAPDPAPEIDPIDPEALGQKDLEKLVDSLFRFSARIVVNAARVDVKTAIKLMEISSRVLVAIRVPPLPECVKRFGVLVPSVSESYRDPPEAPPLAGIPAAPAGE